MRRLALAALLIILASFAGATASADDGVGTYPVRTTTAFEGGSFEAWRDARNRSIADGGLKLYRRESPADLFYTQAVGEHDRLYEEGDLDKHRVRVRDLFSCGQVFSALANGFSITDGFGALGKGPWFEEALHDPEAASIALGIEWCDVIQTVEQAKPSTRGFLAEFKLDETAPEVLPWHVSGFGLALDSTYDDIRQDTERRRLSWAAWRHEAYCEMARLGDWYSWVRHLERVLLTHGYDPWTHDTEAWRAARSCGEAPPLGVVPRGADRTSYVERWSGYYPPIEPRPVEMSTWVTPSILAFGDFNDDGLEDVLIKNEYWAEFHNPADRPTTRGASATWDYEFYQTFTRYQPGGLLTLLKEM